jgi:hypothetical protein
MLNNYQWYRKWRGGVWFYNRHWFDLGRGVIWRWSRVFYGLQGGRNTTQKTEIWH